ncbi:MAG: Biotin--acetyl-CoA-carboxylase ligase [Candidatus Tokpelaia hoelldobleri]|uniref:biotin--[biotin carboxyl-carrier protein] ligase n=1 Tax=Candidatus Tokpelaia hoelldobleri TaxID=1902579 RepID=A0A1U9JTY2_9HYPH|nr:MAG: Biotin--acetyl-CoA-carboxylase ligase [Candidatus Tokpelaia hoelldoblerii]
MVFPLSPSAVKNGYRVESFEKVDSTNLMAMEFARSGDAGKLWVVANRQTSGRARRGRHWISDPGNLYASLLLVGCFEAISVATLGFVAGVSVAESLKSLLPSSCEHVSLQLKWPNDILLSGAKLSGILLELLPLANGQNALIIGIGINIASAPTDTPYPTACWQQVVPCCTAEDVFAALSHSWVDNYALWNGGAGLGKIREKWLSYAANLGKPVHISMNNQRIDGIFETIDENCHFIIRRNDGTRVAVPAGEVHFGTAASVYKKI